MAAQRAKANRLVELDSLRGVAALWVVIFHFTFGVGFGWLPHDPARAFSIAPFQ